MLNYIYIYYYYKDSVPIHRGYHKIADICDRPPQITHVCFVVHGIGQQLASIRRESARYVKI